jgi:hypothetical protein
MWSGRGDEAAKKRAARTGASLAAVQMLPTLLIIGAYKCATTALHRYLSAHPAVYMSDPKELNFFVDDAPWGRWDRGIEWYARHFPERLAVRGEASPSYAAHPIHRHVPERIARTVPDVRIVYLVRDPIDRIVSGWIARTGRGAERRSLAETLADPEHNDHVNISRYWLQLEQYLQCFSPEQILVVDQHELMHRRSRELSRIFRFLGIDESFTSPAFEDLHHTAPSHRPNRAASLLIPRLFRKHGAVAGGARVDAALRTPVKHVLGARIERPVIDAGLRAALTEQFAEDVAQLRRFTGLAFAGWSV